MQNYFFMPALKKVSGGMAVISQIATHLYEANYVVKFVTRGALPQELANPRNIPVMQIGDMRTAPGDRWIIPEGWPIVLEAGMKYGTECAVYVQNWAFLHGVLPPDVSWNDLQPGLFSVSTPVSHFIEMTTGLSAPIVRPAIDREIFHPAVRKRENRKARIAWMPRKNKQLASQIRVIFEALAKQKGQLLPEWIPIDGMDRNGVAKTLQACDIFLATGFPEGCPLPPLEAMACGCLVAGFTGVGGWEYMRQALPNGFKPDFALPDRPWGPNGFFASDGDVWGAAIALQVAYDAHLTGQSESILKSGLETAAWFNSERQKEEITALWQDKEFWDAHRQRLA